MGGLSGASASELQRQFYLAQCGIRLWYPRHTLSGASASPDYAPDIFQAYPANDIASAVVSRPEARSVRAAGSRVDENARARIAMLAESLGGDAVERGAPAPAPEVMSGESVQLDASTSAPSLAEDAVFQDEGRLEMLVWQGNGYLAIAELDSAHGFQEQSALFGQILMALAGHGSPQATAPVHLVWPVFSNKQIPGQGRVGFMACLALVLGGSLPARKLILGLKLTRLLGADSGAAEPPAEWASVANITLGAMLRESSLKRDFWSRLRITPLRIA